MYKKSGRATNMSLETIYWENEVGYNYWKIAKLWNQFFFSD